MFSFRAPPTRPEERIAPADTEVFEATARACAAVGWAYRRVGAIEAALASIVRWLSGYRHPRCLNGDLAARLQSVLHEPVPLTDAVNAVGDRLQVLPTLYHLMWSGAVRADLHSSPLTWATLVNSRLRAA